MVVSRGYFFERVFAGPLDGTSYVQLLADSSTGKPKAEYAYSIDNLEDLITINDHRELFFGVCPKKAANGFKESVKFAGCAWADLDAKVIGSKKEAYERVYNGYFTRPTFLVDSGNGYHAYWCFTKRCYDLEGVEAVNRYISAAVGADHCFNINRLLRVPGTINTKDPKNPKPCNIIHYSGFVYDYEFFPQQDGQQQEPLAVDLKDASALTLEVADMDIGLSWKALIVHGVYPEDKFTKPDGSKDRSARDFGVAMRLVGAGLSDAEIASVFLNPVNKISDKTYSFSSDYERKRYLKRTIGRARALVQQEA